jgi:hypothetical protein
VLGALVLSRMRRLGIKAQKFYQYKLLTARCKVISFAAQLLEGAGPGCRRPENQSPRAQAGLSALAFNPTVLPGRLLRPEVQGRLDDGLRGGPISGVLTGLALL